MKWKIWVGRSKKAHLFSRSNSFEKSLCGYLYCNHSSILSWGDHLKAAGENDPKCKLCLKIIANTESPDEKLSLL